MIGCVTRLPPILSITSETFRPNGSKSEANFSGFFFHLFKLITNKSKQTRLCVQEWLSKREREREKKRQISQCREPGTISFRFGYCQKGKDVGFKVDELILGHVELTDTDNFFDYCRPGTRE